MGHIWEVSKLFVRISSKSLRYVSHDRNAGALNLIAQAEVSRKATVARRFIDCSRDLSGLLPGLNIFEFLECCHFASPLVDEGGLSVLLPSFWNLRLRL